MKIHEYNEMMAYLTRPAVPDPESTNQGTRTADLFNQGGRVGFGSGTPIFVATEENFNKLTTLLADTSKTKKDILEAFGAQRDIGVGPFNKFLEKYEAARGKIPEGRFKLYKLTADSPQVVEGIKLFEEGMSKKAIARKFGIDRKTLRNYFHQFKPEYIGEENVPTGAGRWGVQRRRKKIIEGLIKELKTQPNGKEIFNQMKSKLDGIWTKNDEILKMTDEQILSNKAFKAAMNLDVTDLKAGKGLKFDRYAALTPEEYVSKIRAMAKNREFFQPEHFIPIKNKNVASLLPENIHTAVGKVGGQMEVLKDHIKNKKKYSSDVVKFLESQGIPITKTPGPIKKVLSGAKKVAGKVITGALGPTGIVGLNVGLGADPKNTADRIGIEAEAALAPELVKASIGATKGMKNRSAQKFVQQLLNLGMKTPLALKVARVASPLGWVALGAEGAKFAYDDYQKRKEFITPETITKAQQEQFDANQPMFNEGGRVGMFMGGPIVKGGKWFLKSLRDTRKAIKQNKEYSPERIKIYLDQIDNQIKSIESGGKIPDGVIQTIRQDPKFKSASQTQANDPDLREIEEVLVEYGEKHASGGRVGLAKGPKDPSKRLFIKGVAAASMIPILGKYFKLAKPAAKVVGQYTGPVIEKIKGLEWVQFLAKRLWDEGADVTKQASTMDGQVVRRGTLESGDEVDMIYDTRSGDVSFEVSGKGGQQTSGGAYNKEYGIDYRAGEVIEEGKHAGKKTKADISVGEVEPVRTADDFDFDIVETSADDAMSDLTELEAFAKKKLTKQIHKKKGTKPKDVFPDYDPSLDDFDID